MDSASASRSEPSRREGSFVSVGTFDVPGLSPGREVRAYLPRDHRNDATRPLLVLFDGQNVFGDEGSFAGGWHAHRAVEKLHRTSVNVPVIVGIAHGNAERIDELVPWKMRLGGGNAKAFLTWIASTLVPQLQSRFGTVPGPIGTVVGGSSLGGIAALYAHYRHPETFGGALCFSPSFWVANRAIFPFISKLPRPPLSRIYLDAGGREAGGRMLLLAGDMAELLASKGYPRGQLKWRPDVRGGHHERAWRRRLPGALRFMFRTG